MKWTDESDRAATAELVDLDAWRAEAGACAPLDAASSSAWTLGTIDAGDGRVIVSGGPVPIGHIRVSCVAVSGREGSRKITPEQRDADARFAVAARTGWPRDAARVGALCERVAALEAALSEALDGWEGTVCDVGFTNYHTIQRLRAVASGSVPTANGEEQR